MRCRKIGDADQNEVSDLKEKDRMLTGFQIWLIVVLLWLLAFSYAVFHA